VRTGCFCNPGAGETAFSISGETLIGAEFADGMILDDYISAVGMPTGGAVRASLGLATNFADVYRFMSFATEFRDLTEVPADLPPRAGLLATRRLLGVRPLRPAQRGHEVAQDTSRKHLRRGVLAV
jgi:hypothetical protein